MFVNDDAGGDITDPVTKILYGMGGAFVIGLGVKVGMYFYNWMEEWIHKYQKENRAIEMRARAIDRVKIKGILNPERHKITKRIRKINNNGLSRKLQKNKSRRKQTKKGVDEWLDYYLLCATRVVNKAMSNKKSNLTSIDKLNIYLMLNKLNHEAIEALDTHQEEIPKKSEIDRVLLEDLVRNLFVFDIVMLRYADRTLANEVDLDDNVVFQCICYKELFWNKTLSFFLELCRTSFYNTRSDNIPSLFMILCRFGESTEDTNLSLVAHILSLRFCGDFSSLYYETIARRTKWLLKEENRYQDYISKNQLESLLHTIRLAMLYTHTSKKNFSPYIIKSFFSKLQSTIDKSHFAKRTKTVCDEKCDDKENVNDLNYNYLKKQNKETVLRITDTVAERVNKLLIYLICHLLEFIENYQGYSKINVKINLEQSILKKLSSLCENAKEVGIEGYRTLDELQKPLNEVLTLYQKRNKPKEKLSKEKKIKVMKREILRSQEKRKRLEDERKRKETKINRKASDLADVRFHIVERPSLFSQPRRKPPKVFEKKISRKERIQNIISQFKGTHDLDLLAGKLPQTFKENSVTYYLVNDRRGLGKKLNPTYVGIDIKKIDKSVETTYKKLIGDFHFARSENDNGLRKLEGSGGKNNSYELKAMSTGRRLLGKSRKSQYGEREITVVTLTKSVSHDAVQRHLRAH